MMLNEYLLRALTTKFEGVDAKTLKKLAQNLSRKVETEDEADEAVEKYTIGQLVQFEGDRRATEAAATLRAESRGAAAEQPQKGAAVSEPQTPKQSDEAPEWAKALMKKNEELEASLNAINAARIAEARKQRLAEVTKPLSAAQRKAYERINLDGNDESFENLIREVQGEVEEQVKDTKQRGAVFGRPQGSQSSNNDELTEEQLKAITRMGKGVDGSQPF